MNDRGRLLLLLIAASLCALLLLRTRSVALIDPDEPRFARTSIEMLRSGDYVVPSYEGRPRLVKPPLLHWIQATLFRAAGPGELSARLPAALCTLGSLLILAWVVRRRFGPEGAAWAAACFATMPLVVAAGRLGTLDALLSVHVLGALALDMDIDGPERSPASRAAAIGGLLGMAFLAKGPVGVILPLVAMLGGRTAAGRGVLPALRPALAFTGAWCAVVLPWALAFLRRVGTGDTLELLRREILERYFAGTAHVKPAWFYGLVVLVGFLPWVGPLGVGMVRLLGRRRDPAARTALYAAAGLLAGLLFLSLGRGKLPTYVLPLAPLAAVVVVWELGQELDDPRRRTLGPTLLAGTLGAFGLVLMLAAGRWPQPPVPAVALGGAAIYLAGSLAALVGLLRRSPRWTYGVAALTSASFLLLVVTVLLPGLARTRSTRELIRAVPELTTARPLVVVEMRVPSLVYYLDRVVERTAAPGIAARLRRGDAPLFVVDRVDLPRIDAGVRARLVKVGGFGKYEVFEARAEEDPEQDESKTELPGGRS